MSSLDEQVEDRYAAKESAVIIGLLLLLSPDELFLSLMLILLLLLFFRLKGSLIELFKFDILFVEGLLEFDVLYNNRCSTFLGTSPTERSNDPF